MSSVAGFAVADVYWDHMNGAWGIAMLLGMIAFWVAVTAVIVWLVRRIDGAGTTGSRMTSLEILDRRFAEGELTSEEYKERRELLRKSAS